MITANELTQYREATSGTRQIIHFNNAGASLPPDIVVNTVTDYLREEALAGGYETEYKYQHQLEETYTLIARLINAQANEIAIVENASTAWGYAFNGIRFKKGDVVITSEMEYITNLLGFLHLKQTHGIEIQVIPNDEQGHFPLHQLEAAITPATRLIAITHIPSTAGTVLPIEEIGSIARKHGILYLVDACQTAGHIPIDVTKIQCDILSVTGRKYLRAPRGTGFLYVREEVQDQLDVMLIDGHTATLISEHAYELRQDGRRFELYEKSRALALGLGKAVAYALEIGVDRIWQRIQLLAGIMRAQLKNIPGVTVHDIGPVQCGIITFSVAGIDSQNIKTQLAQQHINVSVGLSKSTLLYMNKHQLISVVRASVHYYNTEEEIAALCQALINIIRA
ncbi:Selenocysteine lyase/Cysteine desulfurase [Filimonas lacunae]|uniref:Selenocysteine lyase/Cysteine desulfurase n=1 Tax=Filimonas lacunae TaxID=477680 RepID=A0A173MD05_9BACT|nr:aminotransferase class V-fold PLP-dependent enzyme [Filimonas lacunae]BAV05397.1 cysteine desulfurase [Filimonas lacunae]SIT21448.1 Selenocysteine lyase/Cysteine desulfurase [Filimonas lacunae]